MHNSEQLCSSRIRCLLEESQWEGVCMDGIHEVSWGYAGTMTAIESTRMYPHCLARMGSIGFMDM